MGRELDLRNQRFGRLIIVKRADKRNAGGYIPWLCRCDCGNLTYVISGSLGSENTRSCGCLQRERAKDVGKGNFKHGDKPWGTGGTRLYNVWEAMKRRCYALGNSRYHRYGGRGIRVCPEWKNDYSVFKNWALTNGYQDNLTIDRINNDGNYEPSNCQFLSMSENSKKRWEKEKK